jgi:hypothetical protein
LFCGLRHKSGSFQALLYSLLLYRIPISRAIIPKETPRPKAHIFADFGGFCDREPFLRQREPAETLCGGG